MVKQYVNNPGVLKMLGEFKTPDVDENGYTQMQMWEVMHAFGNYMYD